MEFREQRLSHFSGYWAVRANTNNIKIATAKSIVIVLCYKKYKKYMRTRYLNFYLEIKSKLRAVKLCFIDKIKGMLSCEWNAHVAMNKLC